MPHDEGKREQFAQLFADGLTYDQIADRICVCRRTLYNWRRELGLKPRPAKRLRVDTIPQDEADQIVRDLYGAPGWTASKIGQLIGVSKNAVIGRAHRMGLSTKKRHKIEMHNLPPAPIRSSCQWIDGDVTAAGDFHYCGEPVSTGSYCQEHAKRAYVRCRTASEANAHIAKELGGMLKAIEKEAREMKL